MVAIRTLNPTTGEVVKTFEALADAELEQRLVKAVTAFRLHRATSFADRSRWLQEAARILDDEVDTIAAMMTTEMGKTLASARAEVAKCAAGCRFYADRGEALLADEIADPAAVGAVAAYATYQPLGPVLAVMPWNFPLWQAMRFAAPALMAGNVGLLKHASNVPQTALFLEELFRRAGFADGVFQTLLIGSDQVDRVLRDRRVVAATLTGSNAAGSAVAATAGEVSKHTVMELGGSDPFVVMPSADLARAATVAATARCQNNGQSCIAAKRFIVHAQVAEQFQELFRQALAAMVVGDPMAAGTDIGPLATEQGRTEVEELVADAVAQGARVLLGGQRPAGPGWFFPPTLITDINPSMRVYYEEVFGPVAALFVVPSMAAALELANDTPFGLGSNLWSDDDQERAAFIAGSDAGMVFINGMTGSYPELPFGGVKDSGYGRELSAHGIREFCNLKTVWIGADGAG